MKVTLPYKAEVRITVDTETGQVEKVVVIAGFPELDESEYGHYAVEPDPGELHRERVIADAIELVESEVNIEGYWPRWELEQAPRAAELPR